MSGCAKKDNKWFKPFFDIDDGPPKKTKKINKKDSLKTSNIKDNTSIKAKADLLKVAISDNNSWMKKFNPMNVDDLAVHKKKLQEVEDWMKTAHNSYTCEILLLTGPVGSGKTITVHALAKKLNIKVSEWITPMDIDIPLENGEFEYRERQSKKFLDFILHVSNFISLLDNNNKKLVLVEDFPNTFMRTPSEFNEVLQQYKIRAKSPIVFICSDSHTDSRSSATNLFTSQVKEQFHIHNIVFNSVSATGLRSALNRVADIMNKHYLDVYNAPSTEMIDCVVNSSNGDVRSAVLNLHFACLKGSTQNLETSIVIDKESKSKTTRRKKQTSKFMSIGKDQSVSLLHGVGRVLNPKFITNESDQRQLSHSPEEIVEQFVSQPNSFINFLHENYLPHFSNIDHVQIAAGDLSDADVLLAEWRENMFQEYGLYISVAGLMLANQAPLSAWNPVRGPKNARITYPTPNEIPLLDENYLYKGKTLVTDYQKYCKIIAKKV